MVTTDIAIWAGLQRWLTVYITIGYRRHVKRIWSSYDFENFIGRSERRLDLDRDILSTVTTDLFPIARAVGLRQMDRKAEFFVLGLDLDSWALATLLLSGQRTVDNYLTDHRLLKDFTVSICDKCKKGVIFNYMCLRDYAMHFNITTLYSACI